MNRCQNCRRSVEDSELVEPRRLWERVAPGEPEPSGECPHCGALCHDEPERAVIVSGNLCDGFRFHGPYDSFDEAAEAAADMDGETWIARLEPPVEDALTRREVKP